MVNDTPRTQKVAARANGRDIDQEDYYAMLDHARQLERELKDAERYRAIKDRGSPFVVYYYGPRIKRNDPDRAVLTPDLDAMIDDWTNSRDD